MVSTKLTGIHDEGWGQNHSSVNKYGTWTDWRKAVRVCLFNIYSLNVYYDVMTYFCIYRNRHRRTDYYEKQIAHSIPVRAGDLGAGGLTCGLNHSLYECLLRHSYREWFRHSYIRHSYILGMCGKKLKVNSSFKKGSDNDLFLPIKKCCERTKETFKLNQYSV